jgi:hypothetical protein
MKPIQLNVTLDADTIAAFTEMIRQAVEHRVNRAIHLHNATAKDAGSVQRKAASMHALLGGNKPPENMVCFSIRGKSARFQGLATNRLFDAGQRRTCQRQLDWVGQYAGVTTS